MTTGGKRQRQGAILEVIKANRVSHQEGLKQLLATQGFEVTQATLSRDIRELRLVKIPGADGVPHYSLPEEWDHVPPLDSILPALFVSAEAVGNFLVVKTLNGGAQAVASGIDWEEYSGVIGTIAGDDTILIILRDGDSAEAVRTSIQDLARP